MPVEESVLFFPWPLLYVLSSHPLMLVSLGQNTGTTLDMDISVKKDLIQGFRHMEGLEKLKTGGYFLSIDFKDRIWNTKNRKLLQLWILWLPQLPVPPWNPETGHKAFDSFSQQRLQQDGGLFLTSRTSASRWNNLTCIRNPTFVLRSSPIYPAEYAERNVT